MDNTHRAGLSTANFVSGLQQGAQFGNNLIDTQRRRKREDRMMGLQEDQAERQKKAFKMRQEQHGMAKESHQAEQRLQGIKFDQVDQEMQMEMNRIMADSMGNADNLSEEDQQFLAAHPMLNARRVMSDEVGNAISTTESVFEGEIDANDPQVMEALQTLAPEIQLGSGNGRKVKPARIVPGPNSTEENPTFMVALQVEGDDKLEFLSENRSAAEDDPAKEIPLDAMMQKVMALKQQRELLSSPEGRQWFQQTYGTPQQQAGSEDPASIKAADAYNRRIVAQGGEPLPFEQAFRAANSALKDPMGFVNDFVKQELEAQKAAFVEPGDDGYRAPEQIRKEAVSQLRALRQDMSGRPAAGSADPRTQNPNQGGQQPVQSGAQDGFNPDEFLNNFMGDASRQPRPR